MNEQIDNFVDLLFNFDMKELEDETKFLENYKKLQQENKALKDRIDKAIEYLGHCDCDQVCENITLYSKILLEILKGDKE